ncbi:hypothetical protein WJX81_001857 [Elliptochloris bilobata]|uniref:J domain-containing protein n=1 Tax=Elliptochloris bilobata TaxID=381761 RepID=A0AAW1SKT0_9CHLO
MDPDEDPLLLAEARRAAEGEEGEPPQDEPMWPAEDPDAVKLSAAEEEALLKGFFAEVREVDRSNEVNRILGAFKLNPFEQLGLRFDATLDEAKRQYRKASLLVHPDKCSHPHATAAFEVLGQANTQLQSEEVMHELRHVLTLARDELRRERKKKTKNDAAVRLAGLVHKEGREGVEAEWERTDGFHEAWKLKARDMLARAEWRRRKLTKRLKEEEERIEEDEADTRKRLKSSREHHKKWEETRETRVGTWRDFAKKKGKKGTHLMGGLKPPKQKEWDEEHTYIQRPAGEQHRPPPQKPLGPQGGPPPPKPPQPQRR